jgi:hypothetical protein
MDSGLRRNDVDKINALHCGFLPSHCASLASDIQDTLSLDEGSRALPYCASQYDSLSQDIVMNTIFASRTLAQDLANELRQRLRAMFAMLARPDASDDEGSTRFSWPRGF